MKICRSLFSLLFTFLLPISVQADQSESFGDYTVHYGAFGTNFLSVDIAKHYKIKRSKNRALINISILKKVMGTSGTPVRAKVSGSATNMSQQLRELNFQELDEDTAVYYLAVVRISNDETLNFDLKIQPEGESEVYDLGFQQDFYTN